MLCLKCYKKILKSRIWMQVQIIQLSEYFLTETIYKNQKWTKQAIKFIKLQYLSTAILNVKKWVSYTFGPMRQRTQNLEKRKQHFQ